MAEQQAEKGSIQVIERMMSLLDVLADTAEPASLKMLSQATGLHPSTAHRILAMMTHSRLVERHEGSTYVLGIRLLELGSIVKSRIDIRAIALPHMQQLHEALGEAINLGIRDGDEIVYLERTSSGRSLVRVVYLVGGRAPLHLTSLGKLFLASQNAAEIRGYAERTGLPGKTPHSLTRIEDLEKELEKVRKDDLAYDNEEAEIGLRCVASPIRDEQGTIVAALSISAPTERHNAEWVPSLKATTGDISRALGYRPATPR
ncbi:IclR family transcriptional regulator [Propionivibrio soli]|jgi:DNA-binding IclR family transcriptional regulator|uniref:IclR family transcriptional regulator n=1 Tax=Propionivibrio soli TaxID=2976531 RepID=UPI0021E7C955|nr:IclR family transcriptional regulator [Propionivibrio soli]